MNAQVLTALPAPETIAGDGFTCPGCGLPFFTQRNPQKPADLAVHTGIFIDFDGSLILCEACIMHLGNLVGMVDPETGKARTSDVRRAQRRDAAVKAAQDARDTAKLAADALSAALDNLDGVLG